MLAFLLSLAALIGGYFIYGAVVAKVFHVEPERPTPAITHLDGVDFVPMPAWKVFLVQFLNIAGLGPIFGAIMGVMYGPSAFLWIVLGTIFAGGVLAVIGVIAAPITTGDTALRSCRLMVADMTGFGQKKFWQRAVVSLPLFAAAFLIMNIDFNVLWRYFAWSNQTLAVFTLWACTVYLARHRKFFYITLLPAMFMTVVSVSYLLVAPSPEGLGLDYSFGIWTGVAVSAIFTMLFARSLQRREAVSIKDLEA